MRQNFDQGMERPKESRDREYQNKEEFLAKLAENYDDIRRINSGGGGIIYSAIHRRLNQKVILKKIREDKLEMIGGDREKKILLGLKSSYLPQIFDFWSYEDEVYTVMEFIEGKSFLELLQEGVKFSQKDVIRWTNQLAQVLEYLHKAGIIHGDIKPGNLMLTPANDICLIDFNVSLVAGSTQDNPVVGYSEGYSPVEQLIAWGEHVKKSSQVSREAALSRDERAVSDDTDAALDLDDTDIAWDLDDTDIADAADAAAEDSDTDIASEPSGRSGRGPGQGYPNPGYSGQRAVPGGRVAGLLRQEEKLIGKYGAGARVDERSDIYSACATMYVLLTGKRPVPCYEGRQTPVEKLVPSANDAFAHILMHGLEQNPRDRFQSAAQMRKALGQLVRSTRRYKRLLAVQDLILLLVLACFLGSGVAAYFGWQGRIAQGFSASLEQAQQYYTEGEHETALQYLSDQVTGVSRYHSQPDFGQAWYLTGCCYLNLEEYEDAANAFRSAILLDDDRPEYYRDYGIALARLGDLAQAEEALKQAQAQGLGTDGIALLAGEIAMAGGDYTLAEENLLEVLNSEDGDIRMRAAVKLDQLYETAYEEKGYSERISLLVSVEKGLAGADRLPVWERLVQAYSDGAAASGDSGYYEEALRVLDQIIGAGYDTLATWLNKGVTQQSLGDYEGARSTFTQAQEKFPETYLTAKRLAFLEYEVQSQTDSASRDYTLFGEYAQECLTLYHGQGADQIQDSEVNYLEELLEELKALGWL